MSETHYKLDLLTTYNPDRVSIFGKEVSTSIYMVLIIVLVLLEYFSHITYWWKFDRTPLSNFEIIFLSILGLFLIIGIYETITRRKFISHIASAFIELSADYILVKQYPFKGTKSITWSDVRSIAFTPHDIRINLSNGYVEKIGVTKLQNIRYIELCKALVSHCEYHGIHHGDPIRVLKQDLPQW